MNLDQNVQCNYCQWLIIWHVLSTVKVKTTACLYVIVITQEIVCCIQKKYMHCIFEMTILLQC